MAKKSFADIKKRKKPVVKKVEIALDGDRADEFNEARSSLERVTEALKDSPGSRALEAEKLELEAQVEKLRAEIEDDVVVFAFRSVGRLKYEELLEECKPTQKQKDDALTQGLAEPAWNDDTFPPALMAASIVEPEDMTAEDIYDIWDSEDWNQAELASLFLAAIQANAERKVLDLGKGFG